MIWEHKNGPNIDYFCMKNTCHYKKYFSEIIKQEKSDNLNDAFRPNFSELLLTVHFRLAIFPLNGILVQYAKSIANLSRAALPPGQRLRITAERENFFM